MVLIASEWAASTAFNHEKGVQVAAFFVEKSGGAIDKLKLVKLAYPPRTAARRDIKQRIHHFAHVRRPTPTSRLRRRNEWRRQPPLAVLHIAWISKTFPAMFAPGNTSSSHGFLHLFAKTAESQDTGIAQLLSDQALKLIDIMIENGQPLQFPLRYYIKTSTILH